MIYDSEVELVCFLKSSPGAIDGKELGQMWQRMGWAGVSVAIFCSLEIPSSV
jgi:hypothetical protein